MGRSTRVAFFDFGVASTPVAFDVTPHSSEVQVRLPGTTLGCPEEAPFDGIIVTAGAPRLPRALLDQLAEGKRLVIPVGSRQEQELLQVEKADDGYTLKNLGPCRFVPLVGPGAWDDSIEHHGGETEFI